MNQFEKFRGLFIFLKKWYSYVLSLYNNKACLTTTNLTKLTSIENFFVSSFIQFTPKFHLKKFTLFWSACRPEDTRTGAPCRTPWTWPWDMWVILLLVYVGDSQPFGTICNYHIPKIIILLFTVPPRPLHQLLWTFIN
jgi:hypothetical protein